ncbi:MAG: polysaccharide biosynthesis protein [Desulfobacterales bacterium]|nr:polysaccharide biosynthesis protein [Desulfobacterales bacterium]
MDNFFRNKNFLLIFIFDSILVVASFYISYAIRFDFNIPYTEVELFLKVLPVVFIIKISFFAFYQIYQGMWRYTSLVDLISVGKAVSVSSLVIILVIFLLHRFEGYPRSIFIIDWAITLIFIAGIRTGIRLYFTRDIGHSIFSKRLPNKKLMIIGAGNFGEKVLREINDNPHLNYNVFGFVDDNAAKHGKMIHGVSVLGGLDEITNLSKHYDEIIIAVATATQKQMRRIISICEKSGKKFRTVPGLGELIGGKISLQTVREVNFEDLLGREEINLDKEQISEYLQNKRILVTGGGGSIGKELVRQICQFSPSRIAFLEMSELNLFQIEMEIRQKFGKDIKVNSFLSDIRRREDLKRIFDIFQPDVVFHAAAYKHVPLQEINPWETILNNVMGTRNVVEIAKESGVKKFVLVSTDKAVRPTNVMGATKRIAELFVECINEHNENQFMAVRFGNVVGSSGSAIPLFRKQIANGGPVTVTHPEMTRYFMSISEAAQLILQAGSMGNGGEIFILDMGRSVKIVDMARDLIKLSGFEPDVDIKIEFVGLRPGEKLYEELITEGEGIIETSHKKIMVLKGKVCEYEMLNKNINELIEIAYTYDSLAIKKKLKEIVPEYKPQ